MEFTKEQLEHIENLIAEKTKGLYTRDDLDKEVQREVDRRVESGIQKGLETHKEKWREEFEKQSKLTAEELAEQKLKEKEDEISAREDELAKRANTLDAMSMLTDAGIPREHYEGFVEILVSGDEKRSKYNVENFINTFNETKANLEKSIKTELSKVPPTGTDAGEQGVNKKKFKDMNYLEKVELKRTDPDEYERLRNLEG